MKQQNCLFDSIQGLDEKTYPIFAHRFYREQLQIAQGIARYYVSYYSAIKCDEFLIENLYREGRQSKFLKMSFDDFRRYIILNNENNFQAGRIGSEMQSRLDARTAERHGEFRQGKKYRKNKAHGKKEKCSDSWYDSNFRKDKQKRNGSYRSEARKTSRKAGNGAHRLWQKEMIRRENFDVMSKSNESYDFFNDPWDWD